MLRKLYLSPFGYIVALVLNIIGRIFRPFMIYGYWNAPTKRFQKLTRFSSSAVFIDVKNIDMGDNCWIGHHSILDGSNGIKIGAGVQIAGLSGIYSHSSHIAIRLCGEDYISLSHTDRPGYVRSAVEIGDYSFIGVAAIILPGVKIGRGCIVAAGSVLNQDLPDHSVAAGNPAKVVGNTLDMDRGFFDDPLVQRNYFDPQVIREFNRASIINPSELQG